MPELAEQAARPESDDENHRQEQDHVGEVGSSATPKVWRKPVMKLPTKAPGLPTPRMTTMSASGSVTSGRIGRHDQPADDAAGAGERRASGTPW
jgi:hypothetical protein